MSWDLLFFWNNCPASAKDFRWEPNGFFSLSLNTGLARWHTSTCIQNFCVLQFSSSLCPFPSMDIHFQLIIPGVIIILQGGHATIPSRRPKAGHVQSTPELLSLTQYQMLWSLLTIHNCNSEYCAGIMGEKRPNLCLKPGLWKHWLLYSLYWLFLYKYIKINHWLVSVRQNSHWII